MAFMHGGQRQLPTHQLHDDIHCGPLLALLCPGDGLHRLPDLDLQGSANVIQLFSSQLSETVDGAESALCI